MAAPIAHNHQLDASMYPIASLLDDLKHEDIQLRLNATRRIKTIADALGPERTRGELLPFITDTIDDEDDVLLALAEQLGDFIHHVGGPAYASVLLQPLETLSTVEESMVREKAVEALCNLSTQVASLSSGSSSSLSTSSLSSSMVTNNENTNNNDTTATTRRSITTSATTTSATTTTTTTATTTTNNNNNNNNNIDDVHSSLHVDHLLPLLHRLATGDWFTSRISACSLVSHVYHHLPDRRSELRADVLSLFKRLAHDDTPMVRRAVASNISAVGRALLAHAPEKIFADLLPVFANLVDDEQDSVRLLVVENAATFANLLLQSTAPQQPPSLTSTTTTATTIATTTTAANASEQQQQQQTSQSQQQQQQQQATTTAPSAASDDNSDAVMTSTSQSTSQGPQDSDSGAAAPNATDDTSAEMQDLAPANTAMTDSASDAAAAPVEAGAKATGSTTTPGDSTAVAAADGAAAIAGLSNGPSAALPPQVANGSNDNASGGIEPIVRMMRGFAEDKSWRVRYMVADQLPELCDALGPAATRSDLLPAYVCVLKDSEAEVRTAAAFKVTEIIKRIVGLPAQGGLDSGMDYVVSEILPIVERLVTDSAQHVRSALASNIMGLAPVLGQDMTLKHLVDVVLALLKDDCPEVRLSVIARLDKVSFVMSIDKLSEELLPAIVELAEDKNWRVRLAIIERIALLARQLGKQFFEDNGKLGELCISWLGDSVFSIREAAITNLKKLTEVFGVDWAKRHIVPQVLNMYDKSSNYLLRMTALHAIGVLSQVVAVETVEDMFLPIVTERASRDPVPNVRFCSAKTLNLVIPYVRHDARESKIKPCLLSLTDANEKDMDVNYFAQQALTKLAQSPCPT